MAKQQIKENIKNAKIQLVVIESDADKKNEHYSRLRSYAKDVAAMGNQIIRWMNMTDTLQEHIIISDDELNRRKETIQTEIEELKSQKKAETDETKKTKIDAKLKRAYGNLLKLNVEAREKAVEFYVKSEPTYYYNQIAEYFPNIEGSIRTCVVNRVMTDYNNDRREMNRGERSIRSYTKTGNIPFMKQGIHFKAVEDNILMTWFQIPFKLYFGRGKHRNGPKKELVQKIMNNDPNYLLCDSSIYIDQDSKIFLNLVYKMPPTTRQLDKNICVGVDMGINNPAFCALNIGLDRASFGSKEGFYDQLVKFEKLMRAAQKNAALIPGGKGRKKKMKSIEHFRNKRKNWTTTLNHYISKKIVEFAIKHNAGIIKMELLTGIMSRLKQQHIFGTKWSYYQLQQMVENKARSEGIEVLYVDPYGTSFICSECGSTAKGQRDKKNWVKFVCANENCDNHNEGRGVNADYNAAVNIARSTKFISEPKESQFYKVIKAKQKQNNTESTTSDAENELLSEMLEIVELFGLSE